MISSINVFFPSSGQARSRVGLLSEQSLSVLLRVPRCRNANARRFVTLNMLSRSLFQVIVRWIACVPLRMAPAAGSAALWRPGLPPARLAGASGAASAELVGWPSAGDLGFAAHPAAPTATATGARGPTHPPKTCCRSLMVAL